MKELLSLLKQNARLSNAELDAMLGRDEATVAKQIAEMEESGIIRGYSVIVDEELADRDEVSAYIELKITPQRGHGYDHIARKIYNYPEVETLYLMSGGFDLAVFIKGRTMREVAFFVAEKLATLEDVVSTATHFVLRKYKDNNVIYGAAPVDERGTEF